MRKVTVTNQEIFAGIPTLNRLVQEKLSVRLSYDVALAALSMSKQFELLVGQRDKIIDGATDLTPETNEKLQELVSFEIELELPEISLDDFDKRAKITPADMAVLMALKMIKEEKSSET